MSRQFNRAAIDYIMGQLGYQPIQQEPPSGIYYGYLDAPETAVPDILVAFDSSGETSEEDLDFRVAT